MMSKLEILLVDYLEEPALTCLAEELSFVFGVMAATRRPDLHAHVGIVALTANEPTMTVLPKLSGHEFRFLQ